VNPPIDWKLTAAEVYNPWDDFQDRWDTQGPDEEEETRHEA
jgi:hypothetical protein